jgi:hypothetical protein
MITSKTLRSEHKTVSRDAEVRLWMVEAEGRGVGRVWLSRRRRSGGGAERRRKDEGLDGLRGNRVSRSCQSVWHGRWQVPCQVPVLSEAQQEWLCKLLMGGGWQSFTVLC